MPGLLHGGQLHKLHVLQRIRFGDAMKIGLCRIAFDFESRIAIVHVREIPTKQRRRRCSTVECLIQCRDGITTPAFVVKLLQFVHGEILVRTSHIHVAFDPVFENECRGKGFDVVEVVQFLLGHRIDQLEGNPDIGGIGRQFGDEIFGNATPRSQKHHHCFGLWSEMQRKVAGVQPMHFGEVGEVGKGGGRGGLACLVWMGGAAIRAQIWQYGI